MSEELWTLLVAMGNVIGCGINITLAVRNLDVARLNAIVARENAETAEKLTAIATRQGMLVLQRHR